MYRFLLPLFLILAAVETFPVGNVSGDDPFSVGKVVEGGPLGPDGKTEVTCDLPVSERRKNVGGRDGAGLCVFTSIEFAGKWQNVPQLFTLQDSMRKEKGGGWPEKVDAMLTKYAPGAVYLQDTTGNLDLLRLALRTGRMPCVTYDGTRDSAHYHNQQIAHMVCLVHLDDTYAVILDNNFIGADQLDWMPVSDFQKMWMGNNGGWCVILLASSPPPIPRNRK